MDRERRVSAFSIGDAFPVSPGHSLVITKRRITISWGKQAERRAVLDLVDIVKPAFDAELQPDGYNVGFNAGEAAGQTVAHFHLHLIPRFAGDVPRPRTRGPDQLTSLATGCLRRLEDLLWSLRTERLHDGRDPSFDRRYHGAPSLTSECRIGIEIPGGWTIARGAHLHRKHAWLQPFYLGRR